MVDVAKLFKGQIDHVFASPPGAPLPDSPLPEVAFIGRSNVGKSSLINALINQKKLARTSKTPGATKNIHFYNLIDTLMIVDLPGYGYAKMSKTESAEIAQHVVNFLANRPQLKVVCVLVDSRHGFKESDKEMVRQLAEFGLPSLIVLTKCDKLKEKQLKPVARHVASDMETLTGPLHEALFTSSEKGFGMEKLRQLVYDATLGMTNGITN